MSLSLKADELMGKKYMYPIYGILFLLTVLF